MSGDGAVSIEDAMFAMVSYTEQFAGNDMKLNTDQIKAADVDGNGAVGVEDAQWILKYYTERFVARKNITWDDILGKKGL